MVQSSGPVAQPNNNYFPAQNTGFPQYSPVSQSTQMSQQVMDSSNMVGNVTHQPSVSSPGPFQQTSGQQVTPAPGLSNPLNQQHIGSISNPSFEASLFDPNDPSMFNFNISDLNFGNQYGALEFGMLGHMTAGAMNTPEMEMLDAMSHSNQGSISYDNTASFPPFPYTQNFQPWVNNRQGSTTNLWALQHNGQDAFAVADTTTSLTGASPHSQNQDWTHLSSSNVSPEARFVQPDQTRHSDSHHHHSHRRSAPFPSDFGTLFQRKRRADTKQIYASVTKGYPYTERFHRFMEFLNKRFPSDKKVRIAKALATIRPSFIALTKDLSEDDLIFMEQGFQRQLIDYDDTWQQIGTPSIICRRTGEIVSCNKEFSLVTGWSRDVLLGKQPNLNVNFGTSASGTQTGSSTRGAVTPRVPNMSSETDTSLPQPVFLAEIMNQDSTVEFWEDFAERAFGASTSSMDGVMCTLIKYKTKDDAGWGPEDRLKADEAAKKESSGSKGEHFIRGEAGMKALGERNGEIEVCMTWLVRRDMFEVPMMIVMNVSHTAFPSLSVVWDFTTADANKRQFLPMI